MFVCVFVCVSARALFPLHPAPLQLMPHLELPMCRSDGLQLPISIFRLLLLLLQNPVQIAQHLLLFVLHGSVFPFLSFTSFSPLFCLLSPSTGPAWTHQCFPFRSSRLDTERQKERGPRLLNPTPFLCWASWCLCVLYICVCVCVCLCVCVATVPPQSMRSALPLQPPLPSPQMLSSHFLDGYSLFLLGLRWESQSSLVPYFFLPFSSGQKATSSSHKQSRSLTLISARYRVDFSPFLSVHCLFIDLLKALDVEPGPANVLQARLIPITGHIDRWAHSYSSFKGKAQK